MKTSELTGALLDYWVARAEGEAPRIEKFRVDGGDGIIFVRDEPVCSVGSNHFEPSRLWVQGGPIIEREKIAVGEADGEWLAAHSKSQPSYFTFRNGCEDATGPTPLIAAMRALVASKFGSEVPDEAAA